MSYLEDLGKRAKAAETTLAALTAERKNAVLNHAANLIEREENQTFIIAENLKDIELARLAKKPDAFIERLTLNKKRLTDIAAGLRQVASLPDPVGKILSAFTKENGLVITKKTVPLGTVGVIFESRPNVSADAAALCFKSGNACVLRGGSDAINSNIALVNLFRQALNMNGLPEDAVQLVTDTSRETASNLMKLTKYIDVLIPRGGRGLIDSVVRQATVPVIQTGAGVCHMFVDESADLDMALRLADNAKRQRPSVCNAIETLLVHEKIAESFLPRLADLFYDTEPKTAIIGDEKTADIIKVERAAKPEDYYTEYGDYIISLRVVSGLEQAVRHISEHGTKHSECIVTENKDNAAKFKQDIDAAAVYVNASTRFTDGFEFGMGAEIGISNQKLHARGPLGLPELTTYKYIIDGDGQVRK